MNLKCCENNNVQYVGCHVFLVIAFTQKDNARLLKGKLVIGEEPLIGANVSLVDDYLNGVITDINGVFCLNTTKKKN